MRPGWHEGRLLQPAQRDDEDRGASHKCSVNRHITDSAFLADNVSVHGRGSDSVREVLCTTAVVMAVGGEHEVGVAMNAERVSV